MTQPSEAPVSDAAVRRAFDRLYELGCGADAMAQVLREEIARRVPDAMEVHPFTQQGLIANTHNACRDKILNGEG